MRVVNIHKEECDVYIGRGSLFGNPYRISKCRTRQMVIDWYREWFYHELKNPLFNAEVEKLRSATTLGCYCKPQACHGDVIIEYLENTKSQ